MFRGAKDSPGCGLASLSIPGLAGNVPIDILGSPVHFSSIPDFYLPDAKTHLTIMTVKNVFRHHQTFPGRARREAKSPQVRITEIPIFPNTTAPEGGRWLELSSHFDTNYCGVGATAHSASPRAASPDCHDVGLPKYQALKLLFRSRCGCLCPRECP